MSSGKLIEDKTCVEGKLEKGMCLDDGLTLSLPARAY